VNARPRARPGLGTTETELIHADGRPEDRRLDTRSQHVGKVDGRPGAVEKAGVAVQTIDDVERAREELSRHEKDRGRGGEAQDHACQTTDHRTASCGAPVAEEVTAGSFPETEPQSTRVPVAGGRRSGYSAGACSAPSRSSWSRRSPKPRPW